MSTNFTSDLYTGLGVTVNIGSDCYPYTIIKISKNESRLTLQKDKAFRKDNNGLSESQDYLYMLDDNGEILFANKRKDGYYIKGVSTKITIGIRRKYNDPSF